MGFPLSLSSRYQTIKELTLFMACFFPFPNEYTPTPYHRPIFTASPPYYPLTTPKTRHQSHTFPFIRTITHLSIYILTLKENSTHSKTFHV